MRAINSEYEISSKGHAASFIYICPTPYGISDVFTLGRLCCTQRFFSFLNSYYDVLE